jgi:hypothetical protein
MLGLARGVLRRFDDLLQALKSGADVTMTAQQLTEALSEYLRRNEHEIYPLYDVMGNPSAVAVSRAA